MRSKIKISKCVGCERTHLPDAVDAARGIRADGEGDVSVRADGGSVVGVESSALVIGPVEPNANASDRNRGGERKRIGEQVSLVVRAPANSKRVDENVNRCTGNISNAHQRLSYQG